MQPNSDDPVNQPTPDPLQKAAPPQTLEPAQSLAPETPAQGQAEQPMAAAENPQPQLNQLTPTIPSTSTPNVAHNSAQFNVQQQAQALFTQTTPVAPAQHPSSPSLGGGIDLFGKKAKKKKMMLVSLATAVFVFGLASAFVFGLYIPNKPENVWKTGMTRTGKEFRGFVDKVSDTETYVSLAKNKLDVSGEFVNSRDEKISFNFDSKFDETKSDNSLGVDSDPIQGVPALNIQTKYKTDLPENAILPNIYFNISGFKDLGVDNYYPGLSKYEGQWISVEQEFFEKYLGDYLAEQDQEAATNVTEEDLVKALDDVTDVIVEYLFSNDPEKALIVNEEFIGTEESEDIQANRYKASLNDQNGVKFCKAAADAVFASDAYKKITKTEGEDVEKALNEAKESCDLPEDYNAEEDKVEFDLWVDKKNKIIHKIRFTEDLEKQARLIQEQKAECLEKFSQYDYSESGSSFCDHYDDRIETGEKYIEVGQIYKGGDDITLFVNYVSNTNRIKYALRADMAVNIKTLIFNGELSFGIDQNGETSNLKINVKTEPFEGEIDASKPDGSIPLQQVMDELTESFNSSQQELETQELGANTDEEIPEAEQKPRSTGADWLLNLLGLPTQ